MMGPCYCEMVKLEPPHNTNQSPTFAPSRPANSED